jgi:TolB-like protein/DNA-binding CsgD family transcriptional regulator
LALNSEWKLTPRQWEVLQLMSKGLTNPDIAGLLQISLGTVKAHVGGIISELGVANRTEAAVLYKDTHVRGDASGQYASGQSEPPPMSLVVLPFSDHSPSQQHEYFAHGLSDELIAALGRVSGLRVVARTTAFALRKQNLTTQEIGERLNVGGLLEGSICILEDELRVNVQLVETKSGYLRWSEVYRTKLVNLIQVQQQIAGALVRTLEHKIGGAPPARAHLPSFEVYQQYLLGLSFWHQRSPTSIAQAIACFQKAVQQDADYTLPYVGLADAYNQIAYYSPSSPKALFEQSQQFLHRAMALEPNLAEALASQGYVDMFLHRDLMRAEQHLARAIDANPNYTYSYGWLSILKTMQGDFAQALDYARKGQALDPLSPGYAAHIGYIHRCKGQHLEAIELYEASFRNDNKDPKSLFPYALSLIDSDQRDKAKKVAQAMLNGNGTLPAVQGAYATIVALCGEAAEAREILHALNDQQPERYLAPIGFAWMHAGLGDEDAALRALRRAVAECNPMSMFVGVEPSFARLRRHAEFPELLRQIGVDTNGVPISA